MVDHQCEDSGMVAMKDIKTYTQGFVFDLHQQLTKDDIVNLCRSLEARFGDGNVFKPERVSDGFIHWVDWPGRSRNPEAKAYKCMRHYPRMGGGGSRSWPIVSTDAMTTWVGSQDVAVTPGEYGTFLKAFYTAPAWTMDELHIVKECLEDEGFKVMCLPSLDKAERKRKRAETRWEKQQR